MYDTEGYADKYSAVGVRKRTFHHHQIESQAVTQRAVGATLEFGLL